jgi:hypothetical protein
LPVEDFLKIIDTIIMDNSGRVLWVTQSIYHNRYDASLA